MELTFKLTDEAWIPCVDRNGDAIELSLIDTIGRAHELREISHHSPLVVGALHRLLLAIIHRAIRGPRELDDWHNLWGRGRFGQPVADYLECWRHRFDLFASERPFYQVEEVPDGYARSAASSLAHELGVNARLFNHGVWEDATALSPPEAARLLVAFQAYVLGGLLAAPRGAGNSTSGEGSPIAKIALVLLRGRSLFETLMLNLVDYTGLEADRPAWEREPASSRTRRPDGWVDLLTWQSRAVKLAALITDDQTLVTHATVLNGWRTPSHWAQHLEEPMGCFRKNPKAKPGEEAWLPVSFDPERAIWRDSTSLLARFDDSHWPPRTLGWLAELRQEGYLGELAMPSLEVVGLSSRRVKINLWRRERLPLPLAYLGEPRLVGAVDLAIQRTETAGKALEWALTQFVIERTPGDKDEERPPSEVRKRREALVEQLGTMRIFWSSLEEPFKRLLVDLPGDRIEEDSSVMYGASVIPEWLRIVERAARSAFDATVGSLDLDARTLRALISSEARLRRELRRARVPELQFDSSPQKEPIHANS